MFRLFLPNIFGSFRKEMIMHDRKILPRKIAPGRFPPNKFAHRLGLRLGLGLE